MKTIVKSGIEEKPYIILPCEIHKKYLQGDFDGNILKPIYITNGQKDYISGRSRIYWIVSYLPINVIRSMLENNDFDTLTHWAFCTHDRDTIRQPDGSVVTKKAHTHLLLYFGDNSELGTKVAYYFHTMEIKALGRLDVSPEWNYLIHDSKRCREEHKVLYDKTERFSDDDAFWLGRCTNSTDNEEYVNMIKDVANGIKQLDLVAKYGWKYIMQYRNITDIARSYSNEILHEKNREKYGRFVSVENGKAVYVDADGLLIREVDINEI